MGKAEKLKKMREQRGLTQQTLAEKSGVNKRTVQNLEQGSRNINRASAKIVYQLAEALDCPMRDILELQDIEEEESN